MDEVSPIEDLSAADLRRLLLDGNPERAEELADFVERIGGPENAWMAVEMLCRIEDWAF